MPPKKNDDVRRVLEALRARINTKPKKNIEDRILSSLREKVRQEYSPVMDISPLEGKYVLTICDSSVKNPFTIDRNSLTVVRKYIGNHHNEQTKARRIFDWVEGNIAYGFPKGKIKYRNSSEVLSQSQGLCGEMAYVYVVLARCCGLVSNFVHVHTDHNKKKVNHACAAVWIPNQVLVDPAYHAFDAKHTEYTVMNDHDAIDLFRKIRRES